MVALLGVVVTGAVGVVGVVGVVVVVPPLLAPAATV
jgi:hypothetical protein